MPTKTMPKFVRLPDELYLGIVADLETGWKISGLDVKPVPDEDDPSFRYVQTALRQGKLEPASQAEYDFIQQHFQHLNELVEPQGHGEASGEVWNEPVMQKTHRDARREIVRLRNEDHQRRMGGDDEPVSEGTYAGWTGQRMKEELKSRGLDTSGDKADLRARLEDDDRSSHE